jgi:hypothetical protein
MLGYPDQARKHTLKGLELARELDHAHTSSVALTIGAIVPAQMRQEAEDLREWLTAVEAELARYPFPHIKALYRVHRGWLLARTAPGTAETAVSEIREGLAASVAAGMRGSNTVNMCTLADACLAVRRWGECAQVLDQTLAEVGETGERIMEAELYRLRGELVLSRETGGDRCDTFAGRVPPVSDLQRVRSAVVAAAEASFQQALETGQRQGARALGLRAATSLARLWRDQGRRTEARELLAPIVGWFSEGFDTPTIAAAQQLLGELASGPHQA